MPIQYIPTSSVEFETLTTEPAYGDPSEFDTNAHVDLKNVPRDTVQYWRILGLLNRDIRLGNLNKNIDDLYWLEDRLTLPAILLSLRDGVFEDMSVLALAPVSATIELSQSRDGFFRKNSRTIHQTNENTEKTEQGGFFSKLFGKKQNGGGSYG